MECLDDDAIAALLCDVLGDLERTSVVTHIDECDDCRTLVADAARRGAPANVAQGQGSALGRYVVLETVGAGAMGVVYAAYDPELDRKVALKVLRNDPLGDGSARDATQLRLLREAQALARVAHPNVITIYDVGTIAGEVFIAMEFVAGGTLADWLAARDASAPVRPVVEMFRQAGEGLAAAHGAGLEHRDFKPDNVLVGEDERVRVTDFGLARRVGSREESAFLPCSPANEGDARVTRTGALVGTPAYMAPE
ncbi:MAG TPA: serine/threonine-protein kinase, partial [Polyangiaceae bacterium]